MRGRCPPLINRRWHTNDLLGGLEATSALSLFEADVGHVDHDSPEAVDKLLAKLGGHPLSVKFVARQVTRDQNKVDTVKALRGFRSTYPDRAGKLRSVGQFAVSLDLSYYGPCVLPIPRGCFFVSYRIFR